MCMQTFPCKHWVECDDIKLMMSGVEIYKLCVDRDLKIPQILCIVKQ